MKEILKKNLLITVILINGLSMSLYAQKRLDEGKNDRSFQKKIYSGFIKSNPKAFLKDSSAIYYFNFKLNIVKQRNGKATAVKILANDSLAYKLFPSYKKLYNIDYSIICDPDKKITLVIPLLIFMVGTNEIKSREQLITIQSAMEILKNASTNNYYDKTVYNRKDEDAQSAFIKVTLADPVIFDYSIKPISCGSGIIK